MKKLATLCLAACLAAALATPAGALDYAIDAPEGPDYGKPTSVEVVHTADGGALKNEDISKNAALIPPGFGSASADTLNTGTWLTPNLAPEGMAVGAVNGSGTPIVFPPSVDTNSSTPATEEEQTTSLGYTPVTSDLYYSSGYLGTLRIPAIGLSVRVYEGTDSSTLMKGAGHFKGTSIWDGNCAIAGHNRGVRDDFGDLHTLERGDTITWTTKWASAPMRSPVCRKSRRRIPAAPHLPPRTCSLSTPACVIRGTTAGRCRRWRLCNLLEFPSSFSPQGTALCCRLFPRFPVCCCCKEHKDSRGKKEVNRMKRKQLIPAVLAGTLIGAALVGPASAGVAALTAAPSTQTFYIDGKQVDLEAYVIHGHNYVQLRDVGRAVDFGVAYDQGANRVLVDTSSPYTEESAVSAPSGVVIVPQSDEPLRLKEGDKVLCDDGTTYEITDLRLWEEPEPLPAYDQTRFPELELPKAEVRRFQSEYGDNLHIRNLYETRRMEYTIYNAAVNCPELWADGAPALNLHLGISAQNAVQMFWPWQEDQLTQVFCSAPGARFEVEAWDVYHNGKYLYTEYNVRGT